jgi:cephalosporin hydroxylase
METPNDQVRTQLLNQISQGVDPFTGFTSDPNKARAIGWNSDHPWLMETIDELTPEIIFECGVWYGGSVITMANWAKKRGLNTQVIACDTFLACHILRRIQEWVPALEVKFGRPTYWENFYANVMDKSLQDRIIPLHMEAITAARYLRLQGVMVDMIHHDSSHQSPDVFNDIRELWRILKPGGYFIIDDYIKDPSLHEDDAMYFNGLCKDVDQFVSENNLNLEVLGVKARFRKPL